MPDTYEYAGVLPALTDENVPEIVRERIQAVRSEKTVIPMLWQGLFKMNIPVDGEMRTASVYVPKDTPQGAPFVFMNIPEGWETVDFLKKSGWFACADREQFCVFAAEPEDGRWKPAAQEAEYLQACYQAEKTGQYLMPQLSVYAVGYGEIGSEVHRIVMNDPLFVAAAAFLDASHVEKSYVMEYRKKNFHFEKETIDIPYRDIPVPVWMAFSQPDEESRYLARYWIDAARAQEAGEDPVYGKRYIQAEDLHFTPEGRILQVFVEERENEYSAPETTEKIYRFLCQYHRYGRGTRSNAVSLKADYKEKGVRFHHFTDQNGIAREYLVYVPAVCRGKKEIPLVLALHGASQSMRNMFDNSLWYRKADQEGFIIAMAESSLGPMPQELKGELPMVHRPLWHDVRCDEPDEDIPYLGELVERIIKEYPVDRKRVYLTGHSMGCMTSLYLGTTAAANRFAAIAATSGVARKLSKTVPDRRRGVPVFLTMGEYDLWSYSLEEASELTDAVDAYLMDNDLADEEHVAEVRRRGAEECVHGMYHDYIWRDADGVPRVMYSWIKGWGHVNLLQPNIRFWDEWFSKWSLDEDGNRIYKA